MQPKALDPPGISSNVLERLADGDWLTANGMKYDTNPKNARIFKGNPWKKNAIVYGLTPDFFAKWICENIHPQETF